MLSAKNAGSLNSMENSLEALKRANSLVCRTFRISAPRVQSFHRVSDCHWLRSTIATQPEAPRHHSRPGEPRDYDFTDARTSAASLMRYSCRSRPRARLYLLRLGQLRGAAGRSVACPCWHPPASAEAQRSRELPIEQASDDVPDKLEQVRPANSAPSSPDTSRRLASQEWLIASIVSLRVVRATSLT
jgi:hypothetical protein